MDHLVIKTRQELYLRGKEEEQNGDYDAAVETWQAYMESLSGHTDAHVPCAWIAKIYEQRGQEIENLSWMERYAEGCTDSFASVVLQDIGKKYEELGDIKSSIRCCERAMERHEKTDLKGRVKRLKRKNT